MPKFVKKPVEIEAQLITEDNIQEIAVWCDGLYDTRDPYPSIVIYTLEGAMTARIGDYIIKGVNGEFYPCKADIFAKTYESSDDYVDPYYINVLSFEDQPDGSAIVNFEMGKEAQKVFTEIGLLKVLTDCSKRVINEIDEIDTNVGC